MFPGHVVIIYLYLTRCLKFRSAEQDYDGIYSGPTSTRSKHGLGV